MKKTLSMLGLVLLFLLALDTGVGLVLTWAGRSGHLGGLVRYFDYGRSVPGKLAEWEARPGRPGNLYDVAWRDALLARSAAGFAAEDPAAGPVIRSYGMSFVNHVTDAAQAQDPALVVDAHAGPGAPPNFTYSLFRDDRANRRAGDVVVLGILSSGVPAMAALSNRTWVFEQPAPFTYPVFRPAPDPASGEDGLARIEPLVATEAQQRALAQDPGAARAWRDQLAQQDAFYGATTFGAPWLDISPFARLVRRALALRHVARVEEDLLEGDAYPYAEVLGRMISGFARMARADGQVPVVMLIQTGDRRDADLLAIARPVLEREAIPYLATATLADPRDTNNFVPDGHYRPEVDAAFARAFRGLLPGGTR